MMIYDKELELESTCSKEAQGLLAALMDTP